MANTKPSSLFSTLKVFRFTGSKPPPPPPKDPNYLYPSSKNPSVVSFSTQSTHHQHPATGHKSAPQSPKSSRYGGGARSIRSPSPTPSRAMQPSPQQQNRPPLPLPRQQSPPPMSTSASTLSPEMASGSSKKGFFRKMSGLRKRSASKSSRMTSVDDATDDESISHPWNFQHHIHIDESFQGIPSTWSSTLADLGYSEAEISLIQKGRRNATPDPPSVQDASRSTTPSRAQSPISTYSVNPPVRSSSLRRQKSDGSIARSERSVRPGPPPPPPPLPLPPPPPAPQQPQAPSPSLVAPAAPPPTPASGGSIPGENNNADGLTTPSGAQYIYVNHQRRTANGLMAVPQPAPVPIIQPVPPRPMRSRSNSVATTARSPPSRSASVSSGRERRFKAPPTGTFRVVNGASPPPAYSDDSERGGSPPPLSLDDAARPLPQEKVGSSPLPPSRPLPAPAPAPAPAPRDRIKTPPPDPPRVDVSPRGVAAEQMNAPGRGSEEKRDEQEEQGRASHDSASSSERRRPRPSDLSILPPRISLRKDTLDDLSSWSASLFSSLPSALDDSPGPSASTAATSAPSSKPDLSKHRTKPSVTLPTIVLHPEVREENEDEEGENENEEGEEVAEQDYSYSASPLYHELMGMMQGRAAPTTNGAGSPGPGSPASPDFQYDTASSSSHGASSRDSQLTIRFNPRRDSSRDSSASTSTLTHATIVRGASIVRRVRADVVTTPPVFARLKGKEREQEQAPIVVQDDDDDDVGDENDDSSSDASGSDEDGGSGSPAGTLALTSGPNSQEDAGGCRSLRLASPASSPLRATFPEPESEEQEEQEQTKNEETQKSLVQDAYVTPPPSAPPVLVQWPPAAIGAADSENPNGVLPSLSLSASSEPAKELENGVMPPRFTSTGAATPRYPPWLAAIVLPLAEFIDDSADPHALFTDLQEIAHGETGSVYSARAAPVVAPQFRPPTPRSPASESSSPSSLSDDDESSVSEQQKPTLVAIKRVPLVRDTTTGLTDLRRELELARALRHANVLRMERLYVDVVEESLWIGMELMDRSLADVLAVVGEEVEDGSSGGGDGGSGGAGLVEISERMVARFVWDVLLALSFIRKHQIAHRDVRSDNLLLSKSGVLKLSDFSTAVRSPPGTPKRSDSVGVIYWQAPEMRTGLYDPLKVDVWSLGATTWELVHGDPPFADVQDTRQIVGAQLPPVRQPEAFSRSFHDFLLLCSQPAATRPDPDELLNTHFIRTACPRSEVVRLLGQCRTIDEHQLRRQSCDSDF